MDANPSDIAGDFLIEAGEIVARLGEELVQLEDSPGDAELLNAIFRGFHTIKGGASFLDFTALVELCHGVEELFDQLRRGARAVDARLFDLAQSAADELARMLGDLKAGRPAAPAAASLLNGIRDALNVTNAAPDAISDDEFEALLDQLHGTPAAAPAAAPTPSPAPTEKPAATVAAIPESSVRVDTRRLDVMMNLVGELVLARNRLKNLRRRFRDEELDRAIGTLDNVTVRLQNNIMRARMQPIGRVLSRFPKVARDVARQLGKQVHVQLIGEDTELDKNLVDALSDPLVHLVRNAIDHGIESPDVRQRAGKSRAGQLTLSAVQEGDHILIVVEDDGAGMNADVLRAKAREKGLIDAEAAARMSSEEAYQLIFAAGFSTKETATDISGRGVGMDVVKSRLKELTGRITIESQRGKGTRFLIRVPLTLAILPTLLLSVSDRAYALPLACVRGVLNFDRNDVKYLDGKHVIDVRGETVPLIYLRRWLGLERAEAANECVILAWTGSERVGVVADVVRGREEVVIKPLPAAVRGPAGLAGAAIIADGNLALVLDIARLRDVV